MTKSHSEDFCIELKSASLQISERSRCVSVANISSQPSGNMSQWICDPRLIKPSLSSTSGYESFVSGTSRDPQVRVTVVCNTNLPMKNITVPHSNSEFQYDSLMSQWGRVCVCVFTTPGTTTEFCWFYCFHNRSLPVTERKKAPKATPNMKGKYLNREEKEVKQENMERRLCNEISCTIISFI